MTFVSQWPLFPQVQLLYNPSGRLRAEGWRYDLRGFQSLQAPVISIIYLSLSPCHPQPSPVSTGAQAVHRYLCPRLAEEPLLTEPRLFGSPAQSSQHGVHQCAAPLQVQINRFSGLTRLSAACVGARVSCLFALVCGACCAVVLGVYCVCLTPMTSVQ